jgi:hypothetical protein
MNKDGQQALETGGRVLRHKEGIFSASWKGG